MVVQGVIMDLMLLSTIFQGIGSVVCSAMATL